MLVQRLLIESVQLRRVGGSASGMDFLGDDFDERQASPGEKQPGPLARKGTRDGATDRASGPVDHGNLVLQKHLRPPRCVRGWSYRAHPISRSGIALANVRLHPLLRGPHRFGYVEVNKGSRSLPDPERGM